MCMIDTLRGLKSHRFSQRKSMSYMNTFINVLKGGAITPSTWNSKVPRYFFFLSNILQNFCNLSYKVYSENSDKKPLNVLGFTSRTETPESFTLENQLPIQFLKSIKRYYTIFLQRLLRLLTTGAKAPMLAEPLRSNMSLPSA